MSHIFGPKLDIVSRSYMMVLIFLPCGVMIFLRLELPSLGVVSVSSSGAMLFFSLSILYASI